MSGLLITGTDTSVGKTYFTCALLHWMRRQGIPLTVTKPVATGAVEVEGEWVSEDTRRLAEAAGMSPSLGIWQKVTPFAFSLPVAPPVAMRMAGVQWRLHDIAQEVERKREPGKTLIVEGVGGFLCPLTDDATIADLAVRLALPVLVVARRSLGTLNHTLLTIEAVRRRGLTLAGVVVNETTPPRDLAEQTNVEELRRLKVPVLGVLQHGKTIAECEELQKVDWQGLCRTGG